MEAALFFNGYKSFLLYLSATSILIALSLRNPGLSEIKLHINQVKTVRIFKESRHLDEYAREDACPNQIPVLVSLTIRGLF